MDTLREALTILRRKQVERRVGLSRTHIYRKVALGEFPAPIRLGVNSVGWIESEISDWISQRIAESRPDAEQPQ